MIYTGIRTIPAPPLTVSGTREGKKMTSEQKREELRQAEEMPRFHADICLHSPESYSLDEKK